MEQKSRAINKRILQIIAAGGLLMSLSGCIVAIPPAIQMVSMALDGVSFATTGKTVTDHAISTLVAKDCAMSRILKGDDICKKRIVEIALLPDGTPVPLANDVGKDITPAHDDKVFQKFSVQMDVTPQDANETINQSEIDAFDATAAKASLL